LVLIWLATRLNQDKEWRCLSVSHDGKRTCQGHGVGRVDRPQVEPHQHLAAPRLWHRLPHDCGTGTQSSCGRKTLLIPAPLKASKYLVVDF